MSCRTVPSRLLTRAGSLVLWPTFWAAASLTPSSYWRAPPWPKPLTPPAAPGRRYRFAGGVLLCRRAGVGSGGKRGLCRPLLSGGRPRLGGAGGQPAAAPARPTRGSWHVYHSAVTGLVTSAERFRRFDNHDGLLGRPRPAGRVRVPVAYHGFPWSADDFGRFLPVGDYASASLARRYRSDGLGVPLVVTTSSPRPFLRPDPVFAATAVLRPSPRAAERGKPRNARPPVHPGVLRSAAHARRDVGQAQRPARQRHLGAHRLLAEPPRRQRAPELPAARQHASRKRALYGRAVSARQDPAHLRAWTPLVADDLGRSGERLACRPEVCGTIPILGVSIRVGRALPGQCGHLPANNSAVCASTVDPTGADPALNQMLLIGHSMGGLVSKLQIIHSGETLWASAANRPLAAIKTSPEAKADAGGTVLFRAPTRTWRG